MSDDDVRAGEELARVWLQGKSEMSDDLALLVDGMSQPLDGTARAFILAIGAAARSVPKGKARPASARIETQTAAQPTQDPPQPGVDLNEMLRRRREREHARRLEEFGRSNDEARREQAEMVRGMGAGGDSGWGR
jgi:hypothetical protein